MIPLRLENNTEPDEQLIGAEQEFVLPMRLPNKEEPDKILMGSKHHFILRWKPENNKELQKDGEQHKDLSCCEKEEERKKTQG